MVTFVVEATGKVRIIVADQRKKLATKTPRHEEKQGGRQRDTDRIKSEIRNAKQIRNRQGRLMAYGVWLKLLFAPALWSKFSEKLDFFSDTPEIWS